MHYSDANLPTVYENYLAAKLQKVLDAANNATAVYSHKRGGTRITWILGRYGEITPVIKGKSKRIEQAWLEISPDEERVLVHYITGFGFIPERDISLRK